MDVYKNVISRYSEGARERQSELCCPVDYDQNLMADLPDEIIEKDYGCGDPSRYVREGDVVLDLGSGGGKICYMAAKLVGDAGKVIGIDMNDDMLALARKYQPQMAEKLGSDRVCFIKGYIQDLALDLEAMEQYLSEYPVKNSVDHTALQDWQHRQRRERPLIADASVDLVISNCVLNLVHDDEKVKMIHEINRVLRPGGRVAISDIISDQYVPQKLKNDAELWSGCVSGAFQEEEFIKIFVDAGFVAAEYDKWDSNPWRVIDGIEFRSVTLTAAKPDTSSEKEDACTIMYRGPFASVTDDEGREYFRGKRSVASANTFNLLMQGPYKDSFIKISSDKETGDEQSTQCCAPECCS